MTSDRPWTHVGLELPPVNKVVETKFHDQDGERNHADLVRIGNLYFFPDRSMYVYYAPTHWRAK